jgi:hypothetical protein
MQAKSSCLSSVPRILTGQLELSLRSVRACAHLTLSLQVLGSRQREFAAEALVSQQSRTRTQKSSHAVPCRGDSAAPLRVVRM